MFNQFVVTATRSAKAYARKVVACLQEQTILADRRGSIDYTDELSVDRFADGEMEVSLHKSVRSKHVILFCGASRNEDNIRLEECKIELYHTIDVLRRSQAESITVFEPFVSCSRSDRTTRRNSVGFWVHYKTLTSLGMDHFITYQLHSDKSKTVFDPVLCNVDDIPATVLLKRYICDQYIGNLETLRTEVHTNWLFCSVDAGGEKLARRFSSAFNTQMVIAHKQRNYNAPNSIESINILSAVPLRDKKLWIVDDMIDTGGSVYELIKELALHGPAEINVAIVHPVFSGPAAERLRELKHKGLLNRLLVCDTVWCDCERENIPDLTVVSSAKMSARIIASIACNLHMSFMTEPFFAEKYFEQPRLFDFAIGEQP